MRLFYLLLLIVALGAIFYRYQEVGFDGYRKMSDKLGFSSEKSGFESGDQPVNIGARGLFNRVSDMRYDYEEPALNGDKESYTSYYKPSRLNTIAEVADGMSVPPAYPIGALMNDNYRDVAAASIFTSVAPADRSSLDYVTPARDAYKEGRFANEVMAGNIQTSDLSLYRVSDDRAILAGLSQAADIADSMFAPVSLGSMDISKMAALRAPDVVKSRDSATGGEREGVVPDRASEVPRADMMPIKGDLPVGQLVGPVTLHGGSKVDPKGFKTNATKGLAQNPSIGSIVTNIMTAVTRIFQPLEPIGNRANDRIWYTRTGAVSMPTSGSNVRNKEGLTPLPTKKDMLNIKPDNKHGGTRNEGLKLDVANDRAVRMKALIETFKLEGKIAKLDNAGGYHLFESLGKVKPIEDERHMPLPIGNRNDGLRTMDPGYIVDEDTSGKAGYESYKPTPSGNTGTRRSEDPNAIISGMQEYTPNTDETIYTYGSRPSIANELIVANANMNNRDEMGMNTYNQSSGTLTRKNITLERIIPAGF